MNTINIFVHVRSKPEMENIVLFQKIYSTKIGIVDYWVTKNNAEHRLEVIIDENDLSIYPSKITKSLSILTSELNIAEQMMMKLNEYKNLHLHNIQG